MSTATTQTGNLFEQDTLDWKDVFFPVALRNVYVDYSHTKGNPVRLESHRALVDVERRTTLSIVSESYRVVTNQEAVEMGRKVASLILGRTVSDELQFYNLVQPRKRSFCHIDLTLPDYEFAYSPNDAWLPFLRITNSYNRTRPLGFSLGFCRAICRNGLIFGQVSVSVSAYHVHGQIRDLQVRDYDVGKLRAARTSFIESTTNLSRFAVPPHLMLPLVCKVFGIKFTPAQMQYENSFSRAVDLGDHVQKITDRYFGELGHNGYAALNVLTDFASRPTGLRFGGASSVHGFQTKCSAWIDDFVSAIQDRAFKFESYVSDGIEAAQLVNDALVELR